MNIRELLLHLQVPERIGKSSVWINDDIRPLPPSRRLWGIYSFISFWAINQICLSNWQLGSALVAIGMSVWQAMICIIVAKFIISVVAIFNGYVGAEWHIGFPVYSRVVWGMYGSILALIQRIFLGLVWFSVQSWTGGLCISALLSAMFPTFYNLKNTLPASSHLTTKELVGWIVYNLITIPMLYIPPDRTTRMFMIMNTISLITLVAIMIWALHAAHGAGPLLYASDTITSSSELAWSIVKGVTTVIGGIAVGLTNQSDYSRFARKPGDQIFGQYFSILTFGTIMPLFGCLCGSATQALYGEAIWNPPNIILRWLDHSYSSGTRAASFFASIGLVVAQLSINTVDNSFSTGMDLSGLLPKYINIRRGSYIGLLISICMVPWELLATAGVFINVMSAYSVFLGPMIGMYICHYWLVCHRKIKLSALYDPSPDGIYYYTKGVNWRAYFSWFVGFATQIPGFINAVTPSIAVSKSFIHLYYLAFPVGFIISFTVYWILNRFFPPEGIGEVDSEDYFGTFGHADIGTIEGLDIRRSDMTEEEKRASNSQSVF